MIELNYKSFGQGDPILILHGMFGTLDNWQTVAKQLAEHYLVYIIDLRNHGRSPHTADFGYRLMAEDVRSFMEKNWIYKAHLIGHSMGGKVVMEFALQYPDMVNSLTVVDIAPKDYEGGHQEIFDALLDLDLSQIESRKEADEKLAVSIKEYGIRQFLLKNLTRTKDETYKWKMNLPVIYKYYPDILANIESSETFKGPTLFIRGEKSNYILMEDLELIKSYFPNASIATVAQAGHWVHAEAPKELISLVTSFIEKIKA